MNGMALEHAKFQSWRSYLKFRHAIMLRARYVHGPEIGAFLAAMQETAKERVHVLPAGKRMWRAQLGESDTDSGAPHPPERMKPLLKRAQEGRANPKGIPYLYLATSRDTAIAEVRPWMGSYVSVGKFRTLRELQIVDCAKDDGPLVLYRKEPRPEKREEAVWRAISRAFSKPVNPCDDVADYVPTQIIAERLKTHEYDGIEYRSSLGEGHNIVLFDLGAADLVACYLFRVKSVTFTSEDTGEYYRVPESGLKGP
jgi:hypothetical protein